MPKIATARPNVQGLATRLNPRLRIPATFHSKPKDGKTNTSATGPSQQPTADNAPAVKSAIALRLWLQPDMRRARIAKADNGKTSSTIIPLNRVAAPQNPGVTTNATPRSAPAPSEIQHVRLSTQFTSAWAVRSQKKQRPM